MTMNLLWKITAAHLMENCSTCTLARTVSGLFFPAGTTYITFSRPYKDRNTKSNNCPLSCFTDGSFMAAREPFCCNMFSRLRCRFKCHCEAESVCRRTKITNAAKEHYTHTRHHLMVFVTAWKHFSNQRTCKHSLNSLFMNSDTQYVDIKYAISPFVILM